MRNESINNKSSLEKRIETFKMRLKKAPSWSLIKEEFSDKDIHLISSFVDNLLAQEYTNSLEKINDLEVAIREQVDHIVLQFTKRVSSDTLYTEILPLAILMMKLGYIKGIEESITYLDKKEKRNDRKNKRVVE